MQKLTNMEAQRVINCLEDLLSRLNHLANIPVGNPDPELLEALEEEGALETRAAVVAQWALEERYLMARAQSASAAVQSRHQHQHTVPQPVNPELVAALHQAVRTTCREVRRHRGSAALLDQAYVVDYGPAEIPTAVSNDLAALHRCLIGLTGVAFRRLATTVEEEAAAKARATYCTVSTFVPLFALFSPNVALCNDLVFKHFFVVCYYIFNSFLCVPCCQTSTHEVAERERSAEDERNALSATLAVQRQDREKEAQSVATLEAKLRSELATITGYPCCDDAFHRPTWSSL